MTQWGEESTVETPAGEVLVTSMRQGLGQGPGARAHRRRWTGKTLKVKGEGAAAGASDTPWPGGVVGLVREPACSRRLKLKPGESFDYLVVHPDGQPRGEDDRHLRGRGVEGPLAEHARRGNSSVS